MPVTTYKPPKSRIVQHVQVRNVKRATIQRLHAIAQSDDRSLNWLICHILDEYARDQA